MVHTDNGSIQCEHVVSCTGNFARKTGQMVGIDIPVIPVEHQYIVTEPHPEILARRKQVCRSKACFVNQTPVTIFVKKLVVLF